MFHCYLKSNKLLKMINGNRNKAGFKHTQWNIDKGLFTMGKLDDIKVKICRDKPHTFCVTEANLVRNEINAHHCNEFSTENLHEKLALNGYFHGFSFQYVKMWASKTGIFWDCPCFCKSETITPWVPTIGFVSKSINVLHTKSHTLM